MNVNVPAVVGVPLSSPAPFRLSPGGTIPPAVVHVIGRLLVASKLKLYPVPTVPSGGFGPVINGGVRGAGTSIVTVAVAVPALFVAATVIVNVPNSCGAPLIVPVPVLNAIPGGSIPPVWLHTGVGFPVALSVNTEFIALVAVNGPDSVISGLLHTVIVTVLVSLPAAFSAIIVNVKFPGVSGVPLSTPVWLRLRPGGNAPVWLHSGCGNPVAWNV